MTSATSDYRTDVRALALVETIADRVATPQHAARWTRPAYQQVSGPQSLGRGAAGIALLHIERARAGLTDWTTVHRWLAHLTTGGIPTSPIDGLYHGALAVAYVLQIAATVQPGSYRRALAILDARIIADLRDRVRRVDARIQRGHPACLAEWDLISGLTGITRYLLDRHPDHPATREALERLVRIATEPVDHNGEPLPGWWTPRDSSRRNTDFAGGHANLGLAHGITGPLALLAIAARYGITVPNHTEAIERICAYLDTWQQNDHRGPWWPQWISRDEHVRHSIIEQNPPRPSWCYGAVGQANAQRLAGRTLHNRTRIQRAHDALQAALTDDRLAQLPEPNLCHGLAGLLHTARHLATADPTGVPAAQTRRLITPLLDSLRPEPEQAAKQLLSTGGPELLEGAVGVALVLLSAAADPTLEAPWDTCLLLR